VQNIEGAPPKPLTAYTLFVKDFKLSIDSGETVLPDNELGKSNFILEAGKVWQTKSEVEKKVYQERSNEMKA